MAQEVVRRVRSPAMVAATAAAAVAPTTRAQKRASTPSSSRRRDLSNSVQPTASPSENGNAIANRHPRGNEIASRYLASSSAAKVGSLSSGSSASSDSKGSSFLASTSCSVSIASSSSSSSSAPTSSPWRFPSPLPSPRPSTPPAVPQTNCAPSRSKSVDRARPSVAATRPAAHNPIEISSAARSLRTTTRSLSVSFQGESFSYQTSKVRPVSPPPINRKPTPERRPPAVSPASPAKTSFKSENPRSYDNIHRWPAARNQQFNLLARSLDCSLGEEDSILAAVRSLRQSMARNEGRRRASFDGGDHSLAFDIDSLSSPSSSGHRLQRLPEESSPSPKNSLSSKLFPVRKSMANGYMAKEHARSSSPGKLKSTSPRRVRNSSAKGSSPVALHGNEPSIFGSTAGMKRGKNEQSWIEDAHKLRLLYNRLLQWRWVNVQSNDASLVQNLIAERYLCYAWMTVTEMQESVAIKKLKLQADRQQLKLNSILNGQTGYLEEWSLMDHDHSSALSGTLEVLKTLTTSLPIVGGAKVEFHEMRNAVGSAVDSMQAIGTSVHTELPKVEGRSFVMSELAELATEEQALMTQCRDIVSTVSAMHVKQCSLLGHLLQLKRPSLVKL